MWIFLYLLFKWMGVFQSWLDFFFNWCISIYLKYKLFVFSSLYLLVPFNTISKCCNLYSHYTFFQVYQTASDVVPILYNKSCTTIRY